MPSAGERNSAQPSSCSTAGESAAVRHRIHGPGGRHSGCTAPHREPCRPTCLSARRRSLWRSAAKSRPPRARFKLRLGIEEERIATDAGIKSVSMIGGIFAGEWRLRPRFSRDVEGLRRQLLPPFRFRLFDLFDVRDSRACARWAELDDSYRLASSALGEADGGARRAEKLEKHPTPCYRRCFTHCMPLLFRCHARWYVYWTSYRIQTSPPVTGHDAVRSRIPGIF